MSLRQRVLRVSRVDGSHRFVVFGKTLQLRTRYLERRDRAYTESQRIDEPSTSAPWLTTGTTLGDASYYVDPEYPPRCSVEELARQLAEYDVISFDIFDTALQRCVENPHDVFRLLGAKMGSTNFATYRRRAESYARARKDRMEGTREVSLSEIYDVLRDRYHVDPKILEEECELELLLARPNDHIRQVHDRLKAMGKTIVFMSDMYLPRELIERMLTLNGYAGFDRLYLSSEHLKRKGDGTLQPVLLADYPDRRVVHVGDAYEADISRSLEVGLDAIYNADQRGIIREGDMGSLAGSFYTAVISNALGSGTWNHGLHYTHGFRVGGILALGYCEFLNRLAEGKSIDRILFCGRDCDVIARIYAEHFGSISSQYVDISRYAISGATLDENFDDYIGRSFLRWLRESDGNRTLEQLLDDTGFDYLVPYLEDADIERFLLPASTNRRRVEQFLWDHRHIVQAHNATTRQAAEEYFKEAVADARSVLIVDIGWSGTCILGLRQLLTQALPERDLAIFGALMCTSRSREVTDAIDSGLIHPYVYSPTENLDLARFMMPGGRNDVRLTDLLHLPLECLFTEPVPSVTGYAFDQDRRPVATRGSNSPQNASQISDMQRGIEDFVNLYLDYSRHQWNLRPISSYVAFNPLKRSIRYPAYTHSVYRDFLYDATPALFAKSGHVERFGDLFDTFEIAPTKESVSDANGARILFVSPEMVYAGAPRSLLRMCKVASSLGYKPMVWTAKPGAFAIEFERIGVHVEVVPAHTIDTARVNELKMNGVQLVVCNTVVTDAYVRALEGLVPLVWYVREASNVTDFFRSNTSRIETLRRSRAICCVSEYAAEALRRYADGPIGIVRNSVEDVSMLALPYEASRTRKHRFIQLGTIERRKGYDLFIAAFKALPQRYRDRAELHFAGGFINSGVSYSSYIFSQVKDEPAIHYHGLITDESQRIELISQMDTVVVASRDESCSLVALEGAMLSKPLIVTENVGAKYIIDSGNGLIIESGSVAALRDAFMSMMDAGVADLTTMGVRSRESYDHYASMDAYVERLRSLFDGRIGDGARGQAVHRTTGSRRELSATSILLRGNPVNRAAVSAPIVSLTSFPQRIATLSECVESLKLQSLRPERIILNLSREQFPNRERDLPADLLEKVDSLFEIRWVDGDLAPHKKYLYSMQDYPDFPVITVDDDVVYSKNLVETLQQAHLNNRHAVICERANLVMFRPDGSLRNYDGWIYDCQFLRGSATYQLLPTGVGGVLYPPNSLPREAFDPTAISRTCLRADDLWLKVMTAANGYPVWMPQQRVGFKTIQKAQAVGLWRANSYQNQNDLALRRVLDYFERTFGRSNELLMRIRGVDDDGRVLGPEDLDMSPLL